VCGEREREREREKIPNSNQNQPLNLHHKLPKFQMRNKIIISYSNNYELEARERYREYLQWFYIQSTTYSFRERERLKRKIRVLFEFFYCKL